MTGLLFILQQESISLAMDTLVSYSRESEKRVAGPRSYATKFHPLPHLRAVMCGTGIASFVCQWYAQINTGVIARDILVLDEVTPRSLRELWDQCADHFGFEGHETSTIYQFGYDPGGQAFVGFAYRSTNDFESEPFPYGWGIKPPEIVEQLKMTPEELSARLTELSRNGVEYCFSQLMREMRMQDESQAGGPLVGIGGETLFFHMTADAMVVRPIDSFEDKDDMYAGMLDRLHQDEAAASSDG